MTLRDALDFALTSLRGNLAKSLLTVLGLGVGVGAVLTVLSLGDAGEIRVEEEIARLGVDKVWFCAENPAYPLTEDCRAIAASTGADVCLGASTMDAVSLGGQTVYAQIAGYDDGLEAVHHPSSVQGRMFTVREYSGERVALLDETLAGRLNAAVGDFINCGGRRYCIVGVVAGMPAQSWAVECSFCRCKRGRMPMRWPQQNWHWPSRRAKRRGNWLRMFWRSCTICRENISP